MARGDDTDNSDCDFLVRFTDGASLFDQAGLKLDLEKLLGCDVDVISLGRAQRQAQRRPRRRDLAVSIRDLLEHIVLAAQRLNRIADAGRGQFEASWMV